MGGSRWPVGIGCPDPEDPLIDVLHWKPGAGECITVSMNDLYALDPDVLGLELRDTLVCDLSGRFATKGVKDPGPPSFKEEKEWDAESDWCRDRRTGLINITPVDQILPKVAGVSFVHAIPVEIDVKPGSGDEVDAINSGRSTRVPVAVMGREDFDVARIDPSTAEVTGSGIEIRGKQSPKTEGRREDLNSDGVPDLLIYVDLDAGGKAGSAGHAYLEFSTVDDNRVMGRDLVRIVPAKAD